ncbi:hypothetical protein [Kriegella aquimaris]|uniref:Uncharacterized protein n=1 Tax=Kriegella aquimaris TaxID=192904 RepID=A0A1G9WXI7_9FLAO|nr:hypothetical protein [Kriegella aquimaris]SDM89177.1 hypothetical protein SAMN04488514_116101 [Kriegella aquimaris]
MKNIVLIVAIVVLAFSCSKNNEGTAMGELGYSESYEVKISGSHPDGAIDSHIIVTEEMAINMDKVELNSVDQNGSSLTITIHLPADETASDKKESIGFSISNLEETNIWNIEDTYQTFHVNLSADQKKKAIIDYVIDGDNLHYGSLFRFEKGTVNVKREGILLKGTFAGKLERDGRTGLVDVSGSFVANLDDDNLN